LPGYRFTNCKPVYITVSTLTHHSLTLLIQQTQTVRRWNSLGTTHLQVLTGIQADGLITYVTARTFRLGYRLVFAIRSITIALF